jgi:hypothetical protein
VQFHRPVGYAALLALAAGSLTLVATPAVAASPDLVISQVYGGGGNTGAPFKNGLRRALQPGDRPVRTRWAVAAVRQRYRQLGASIPSLSLTPQRRPSLPGAPYL